MELIDVDRVLVEHLGTGFAWGDGAVGLDLDGYVIGLEYEAELDVLYLTGEFPGMDRAAAERCGEALLQAGLFGAGTGGYAVFGYDAEDGMFVLWDRMVLSETGAEQFQDRLARFQEAMEEWTERLGQLPAEDAGPAAAPLILA